MTLPASVLLAAVRQAALLPPDQIEQACALAATHPTAAGLAAELVRRGWLTAYQAAELCEGRGLTLAIGSYVLLDRLGVGGMGEVFRARHRVLEREDAVKRILPGRLDSPDAVERFLREAKAAARLRHPNVVQVHDAGESNGAHYLAMELLPGENLAECLHRRGPLPVAEAVDYVRQACVGMQHAHEKGLVHRDLKPGNLMLCDGRVVKIMDLGLALVANAGTLTQSGGSFGTVDYMAPEQVIDSHGVDIRADVYSLGCTLYQLLAGRTPFQDAHPAARPSMHINQEPMPVEQRRPDVPPRVAAVVRTMMAKKPEQRYQTPGAAADALGALLKGKNKTASPPARARTVPPPLLPAVTKPLEPNEAPPPRPSLFDKQTDPHLARANGTPTTIAPPRADKPARSKAVPLLVGLIGAALALVLGCVGLIVVPPLLEKSDRKTANRDKEGKKPDGGKEDKDGTPAKDANKDRPKDNGKVAEKDAPKDVDKEKAKPPDEAKLPDTFGVRVGKGEMTFVRIKAGKFRMGSLAEEKERRGDEEQQHDVEITKDFWLGKYEVTQAQYREVMGYNPSYFSRDGTKAPTGTYVSDPAGGKDKVKTITDKDLDDFPVENVSWQDAQEFLKKLTERSAGLKIRLKHRLPTEAEWEYACRGSGPYKTFSFGNSLSSNLANFNGNFPYGGADKDNYLERTTKVGSYPPDSRGLCDVHGNVYEWCEDCYDENYYANSPPRDPLCLEDSSRRVSRGGSWRLNGQRCRSASRAGCAPGIRNEYLGFRVALVPAE